jgi:DNA-binding GntR family transcriptional regulator
MPFSSAPDRSLLRDRAYREIEEQIQIASSPPGSFLSERQLAVQLGMSKTPIKAALMHRVIFQVMSREPSRLQDAVKEHSATSEAIHRGKSAAAGKLIEQHLEYGKQSLMVSG